MTLMIWRMKAMKKLVFLVTASLLLWIPLGAYCQDTAPEDQPAAPVTDEVEALRKLIAEQRDLINKLTKELSEVKEALEQYRQEPGEENRSEEPKAEPELPAVGKITKVRMDRKLVLIDLGKDHGLAKGDLFEVSRAGKKIGRVKVCVAVDKNMSNAEVVEAETDFIEGDRVERIGHIEENPPANQVPEATEPRKHEETTEAQELPADSAQSLRRRLELLEDLCTELNRRVERIETNLDTGARIAAEKVVRESVPPPPSEEPKRLREPSNIEAEVVLATDTVVFISAGEEQGVKQGDTFLIKRGDREIATVRVTKLIEDMCKAEVVDKKSDIQKEDTATLTGN